jgi:PiT family inorganic phosphate transporter
MAIALGGILNARRVADTMSHRITAMNHGQGFTANLVTSVIVIGASRLGMPVSTTHVSCGALFGIGTITGQAGWRTIGRILMAWVTTLPLGAALGATTFLAIRCF